MAAVKPVVLSRLELTTVRRTFVLASDAAWRIQTMIHWPSPNNGIDRQVEVVRVTREEVNLYCGFTATNCEQLNWDIAVEVAKEYCLRCEDSIRIANVYFGGEKHLVYF